jgi:hypothetical protein
MLMGSGVICFSENAQAEPSFGFTADEYRLYIDWRDGCLDPRLAGASDASKLKKIASNLGVNTEYLQNIISRVGLESGSMRQRLESALQEALQSTPLANRADLVTVNTDSGHVVAGVRWKCDVAQGIFEDAAYAAWAASQAGSWVSTAGLWCVDHSGVNQFSATIGRSGMIRIDRDEIPRFAASRYMRLFEKPKYGSHAM